MRRSRVCIEVRQKAVQESDCHHRQKWCNYQQLPSRLTFSGCLFFRSLDTHLSARLDVSRWRLENARGSRETSITMHPREHHVDSVGCSKSRPGEESRSAGQWESSNESISLVSTAKTFSFDRLPMITWLLLLEFRRISIESKVRWMRWNVNRSMSSVFTRESTCAMFTMLWTTSVAVKQSSPFRRRRLNVQEHRRRSCILPKISFDA